MLWPSGLIGPATRLVAIVGSPAAGWVENDLPIAADRSQNKTGAIAQSRHTQLHGNRVAPSRLYQLQMAFVTHPPPSVDSSIELAV